MVARTHTRKQQYETLPWPYSQPTGDAVEATPATMDLVQSQVRALVTKNPTFLQLPQEQREGLTRDLSKIASYWAALMLEEWKRTEELGQKPVVRQETVIEAPVSHTTATDRPLARAQASTSPNAEEFSPRAASQVARITERTLNAIAFPTFVSDLIQGTFRAIVDASIQQMEAFGNLLANVAKTVDQFMADNITDNQARDYLAETYPGHFRIDASGEAPRLVTRRNASDLPTPDFQRDFQLPEEFTSLDEDEVEETLVPAARRKLARNRHQMLAAMVLMGINRIVVTRGRISAKMGFRIDASDTGRAETASQFDFQHSASTSFGGGLGSLFGGPRGSIKTSVAYVSSTKKESSDELNVEADLTGEVDLRFRSDVFPLERFADPAMISLIQGNTPNPAGNVGTGATQEQNTGQTGETEGS